MECPRTDKARRKKRIIMKAPETPSIAFQGYRVAHRRAAVAVSSVSRCARWSSRRAVRSGRSCRWPRARGNARRGTTQRGRGGGGGSSRGGAGGGRGGRGAPRRGKPRGRRAASELRLPDGAGTSARTPRARRVAACPRRGALRDALSPKANVASSSVSSGGRRSACRARRGAGCAADARPRAHQPSVVTVEGAVAKQGDKALSDAHLEIAGRRRAVAAREGHRRAEQARRVGEQPARPGRARTRAGHRAKRGGRERPTRCTRRSARIASDDANGAHEAELRASSADSS